MAIGDRIKRATGNTYINIGKRLFGVGKDPDQAFYLARHDAIDRSPQFLDTYKGAVFACVSAIGEAVGKYQPHLHKQVGDGLEDINTHPFLDLLANPQPLDMADGITQYDLFEATQSFMDLQGECFWYLPYGAITKTPKEIHILRPDRVGVSVDKQGEVDGYYLKRGPGQDEIPFTIQEIMHFKRFNPKNPYRGMSIIQAGLDYIETEEATSAYTKNFFKNNAGLSGVLNIKGEVSRNAFKKFAAAWREKYEGVDNAGKVAIVRESESAFTKVGLGLNELDMDKLKKMSKDDVFMMFRTPRGLFGLSDDTGLGRASVETLEYIFAKHAIEPKMLKLDSYIMRALKKYYPEDDIATVTHTNIIPADKDYELKRRAESVDKWATRDEIRDEDGNDPVPGGDKLFILGTNVPIDQASAATATAGGTSNSRGRLTVGKDGKLHLVMPKKQHQHNYVPKAVGEVGYEHKEQFRLRLEQNKLAYTAKYKAKFLDVMENQKADVLDHIAHMGKDIASQLFDLSDANGKVNKAMYPILLDVALEQGALALVFAGDDESDFDLRSSLEAALRESTQRMAVNFNQATLDELSSSLADGVAAGESLGDLKNRVEDVYGNIDGWRAERVARTESGYATGEATLDAYRQTGYVIEKQWFANPGACEFCQALDGTSVGLDDTFVSVGQSVEGVDGGQYDVTYMDVEAAELHPNCNCTIIPVRQDA